MLTVSFGGTCGRRWRWSRRFHHVSLFYIDELARTLCNRCLLTIFVNSWGAAVNLDSLCMLIIECYCSSVSQELTLRQITRTVTTEHWNRH